MNNNDIPVWEKYTYFAKGVLPGGFLRHFFRLFSLFIL